MLVKCHHCKRTFAANSQESLSADDYALWLHGDLKLFPQVCECGGMRYPTKIQAVFVTTEHYQDNYSNWNNLRWTDLEEEFKSFKDLKRFLNDNDVVLVWYRDKRGTEVWVEQPSRWDPLH